MCRPVSESAAQLEPNELAVSLDRFTAPPLRNSLEQLEPTTTFVIDRCFTRHGPATARVVHLDPDLAAIHVHGHPAFALAMEQSIGNDLAGQQDCVVGDASDPEDFADESPRNTHTCEGRWEHE